MDRSDWDFRMIVKPGLAGDLRGYQGQSLGGRPSEISGEKAVIVRQMAGQRRTYKDIARAVNVDQRTVSRFLRAVPDSVGNKLGSAAV
jgi:DNA invertase Pin-like site-specific DNA recombinase